MTKSGKRVLIHDEDGNLLPIRTCIYCGFQGVAELFLRGTNRCLPCNKTKHREYTKANELRLKDYRRQRYLNNRDAILEDQRERKKRDPAKARNAKRRSYLKHRAARLAKMKSYRETNREAVRERKKKAYIQNRESMLARQKERREAMAADPIARAADAAKKKAYYEANKEKILAAAKLNYVENKDQHSIARKAYYATHKAESIKATKAWQAANPEKRRAVSAAYAKRHPERRRATCRAYEKTPNGKAAQANCRHRRRAAINDTEDKVTNEELIELRAKAKGLCYYCRKKRKLEVEHIVPVSRGGKHERSNLVMACKPCNSGKNNLPPEVYARKIGLLLI